MFVLLCHPIGQGLHAQDKLTGLFYYAVEDLDNNRVVARGIAGSQGAAFDNLILAPNTNFRIWLLEAATFRSAHVKVTTPNAGLRFNIPPFFFTRSSSHDSDGDELHDLGEFIVGTLGLDTDSDDDGILDGAEVAQGLDPLEGTPARTGIIGSADTPGQAQDVDAFNDIVVVADSASGVHVFNVFNGMNPLIIAQVNTPGIARSVSLAGNFLAVADGNSGLAIIDVTDPPAANIFHQISLGSATVSTVTDGQFAFVGLADGSVVAVEMGSGLIVDRIDLTNSSQVDDLRIYGGRIYALIQSTLFILEFEFAELTLLSSVNFSGGRNNANGRMRLFVGGDIAYPVHTKGYNTIDVSDPANPTVITNTNTPQFGWKHIVTNGNGLGFAAMSGNQAFDGPHNVSIYDVSDPTVTSNLVANFETPGVARAVTIYNGIGYVADHTAGLHVVNYLAFDSLGQPPTVTIVEPEDGASVEEGSLFLVRADVQDDVQVRNVEFYVDDLLIKTDGNFPFEVTLPAGSLDVTNSIEVVARASDTGGNASFSEPITLNLTPDSTPPRINSVLPSENAIIGDTSGFTLFFSEAIDPDTIDEISAHLIGVGEDGLFNTPDDVLFTGGLFSFSDDGSIVSYLLDEVLDSGYFRITVETTVTDNIGNALRQQFISVFLALGDADTDQDGLTDVIELNVGLDPNDPDSDNDGISDGKEDIDGDGVTNDIEAFLGFNLGEKDSDLDGTDDNLEDADMDGLPDFQEVLAGTNLNVIDSDGDGFSDEAEVLSGSSPIDPNVRPELMVFARPKVSVLALASTAGAQSTGVTLARPPISVLALSSDTGDLPPSVTIARPPVSVLALSSDTGDLPPSVTMARPPVSVLALSSDTGDLPPSVTVAHPPVSVMLLGSTSGDLSAGVTVANPPVTLDFEPE